MNCEIMEPPLYLADYHIFNLDFHPYKDIFACCMVNG